MVGRVAGGVDGGQDGLSEAEPVAIPEAAARAEPRPGCVAVGMGPELGRKRIGQRSMVGMGVGHHHSSQAEISDRAEDGPAV